MGGVRARPLSRAVEDGAREKKARRAMNETSRVMVNAFNDARIRDLQAEKSGEMIRPAELKAKRQPFDAQDPKAAVL